MSPAQAQPPEPKAEVPITEPSELAPTSSTPVALQKRPLGIVISGGASLGIHEAGYLYIVSEALKNAEVPLRVVTGASAGSGNSLLTALSTCLPSISDPETSMGWHVWVPSGFDDLFDPASTTPISAFSTRAPVAGLRIMEEVWRRGLPTSCDVVVAVTVTKLDPIVVQLVDELTAPRQLLRVAVRIRGRGPNQPPSVENVVDPSYGAPQMLLPFSRATDKRGALANLDRLIQLITASGAFPLAFPPVELEYCLRSRSTEPCDSAEEKALFIDGGAFDNIPLRLANGLSKALGLKDPRFLYVDPVLRSYPEPRHEPLQGAPSSALSFGARFAAGFVDHARNAELYALLEDNPSSLQNVLVGLSRYPQASGFLRNFFGLFDTDFRRFDFYLGMYDALQDLERWPQLAGPEVAALSRSMALLPPLACMSSWYDDSADHSACDDPSLRNLRILTQISLDRVYSSCRESTIPSPNHPHCERARRGGNPPAVVEMARRSPGFGLRRKSESPLDHNLRLLSAYGYHFRDLGLPPSDSRRARAQIAKRLGAAIARFAHLQPDLVSRNLIEVAGLELLSPIHYEPPRHLRYLMLGTAAELGASWALPRLPSWIRINTAMVLDGLVSMVTQDATDFDLSVVAGPEIELRALTTRRLATSVGARVGYQLGWGDRLSRSDCTAERAKGDGRDCSQMVVHGVVSLSIVERLRLQTSLIYYPKLPSFDDRVYNVHFGLGYQF